MARGLERHREHQNALAALGKDLARRARSTCELCEASGVPLHPYEVPPAPAEPELESCVLLCETCREQLDHPPRRDANHWRCLNKSVWSQVTPVQVLAVRMLRELALRETWAAELLEQVYITPEVQAWVEQAPV